MHPLIAETPKPPYYVVVFTIVLAKNLEGYEEMGGEMVELVSKQPGFLGMEYAGGATELTISYWESYEAIQQWKTLARHLDAKKEGQTKWFDAYKVRIAKVEEDYDDKKAQ
jgi:heme-degrading monooxygenase HmoA